MPSTCQSFRVVLLCFGLAACRRGRGDAAWHYVATGKNGEKFYVDTSTLHASGAERSFTLVAVEQKPKISFGTSYDRTTTDDRVTCGGTTFVFGEARGYSGDSVVFDNPGENPVTMTPGGPFEAVQRYVCGR